MTVFSGALTLFLTICGAIPTASDLVSLEDTVPLPMDGSLATINRDLNRRLLDQSNRRSTGQWHTMTPETWSDWKAAKLARLRSSLGTWPDPSGPIRFDVTGEMRGEGFVIENTVIESRPDCWVTANLYRPDPIREGMPAILISHAHHTSKTHGELQDMGMTWARAGCLVLIPDHPGHGERRQHPFHSTADFAKPFATGRQDYFFRYDLGLQLSLAGQSLAGWMAWDLMRGADYLLSRPGVDARKLILLGAVAGGGDPAAIAGALDERFTAVCPFNFGGPQPETRYPLPVDSDDTFEFAGSGSWESTRNLAYSARDGFLPWIIVGSIAPRRLIYGHEFRWDRDHDPVWRRLGQIYDWHNVPEHLAFTHGRGELKGQPPESTHCTHIGPVHRVGIHQALQTWFKINAGPETEYSQRVDASSLRCWTPEARSLYQPASLVELARREARTRVSDFSLKTRTLSRPDRRKFLRSSWGRLLGESDETPSVLAAEKLMQIAIRTRDADPAGFSRLLLTTESGVSIPVLMIEAPSPTGAVVVAVCSQGKGALLKSRSSELAELIQDGATICLVDPRGIGELSVGTSRGRRSAATAEAATALMVGRPIPGQQLQDVRTVIQWLRTHPSTQGRALALWGESLAKPNPSDAPFQTPRDDDQSLPTLAEPQGPLMVLLAGLFEDDLRTVIGIRGLISWQSLFDSHLVLVPGEVVVPSALSGGEIGDLIDAQSSETRIAWVEPVDGLNRAVTANPADVPRAPSARPQELTVAEAIRLLHTTGRP